MEPSINSNVQDGVEYWVTKNCLNCCSSFLYPASSPIRERPFSYIIRKENLRTGTTTEDLMLKFGNIDVLKLIYQLGPDQISQLWQRDINSMLFCERCANMISIIYKTMFDFKESTHRFSPIYSIVNGVQQFEQQPTTQPNRQELSVWISAQNQMPAFYQVTEPSGLGEDYVAGHAVVDLGLVGQHEAQLENPGLLDQGKQQIEVQPTFPGSAGHCDANENQPNSVASEVPVMIVDQQVGLEAGLDPGPSQTPPPPKSPVQTMTGQPYECDKCGKSFDKHWKFLVHMRSSRACKKTFTSRSREGKNTYRKCSVCGNPKISPSAEAQHLKSHQNAEERLKCCGIAFESLGYLRAHARTHGKTNAPIQCKVCSALLRRELSLRVHMEICHGQVPLHACEICGRPIESKYLLGKHRLTHYSREEKMAQGAGVRKAQPGRGRRVRESRLGNSTEVVQK